MPTTISSVVRLAPDSARGEKLVIRGRVLAADGKTPAAGVLLYFYHTNANGRYGKTGHEDRVSFAWWHGYCRGWAKTNARGEYEVRTIRPAPYPDHKEPAHIHVIVKAPTQRTCYYLPDLVFKGDPLLTDRYWYRDEQQGHIRYGGIALVGSQASGWRGQHDFTLYAQYDVASLHSGPNVGEPAPALDLKHVWGPDRATTACPMCKYGYGQGAMVWLNTDDLTTLVPLARRLEAAIASAGTRKIRVFLIYLNPSRRADDEVERHLTDFARSAHLSQVAVAYLPGANGVRTASLYRINPSLAVRNTVLVYQNRRVIAKFINAAPTDADSIVRRMTEAAQKKP